MFNSKLFFPKIVDLAGRCTLSFCVSLFINAPAANKVPEATSILLCIVEFTPRKQLFPIVQCPEITTCELIKL